MPCALPKPTRRRPQPEAHPRAAAAQRAHPGKLSGECEAAAAALGASCAKGWSPSGPSLFSDSLDQKLAPPPAPPGSELAGPCGLGPAGGIGGRNPDAVPAEIHDWPDLRAVHHAGRRAGDPVTPW